jgi:acetyltransferase
MNTTARPRLPDDRPLGAFSLNRPTRDGSSAPLPAVSSDAPALWSARNCRPVILRTIRAHDEGLFADFVRTMSPASRHNRFHVGLRELPQSWLDALVRPAAEAWAVVAIAVDGGRTACVAEARHVPDPEAPGHSEFAIAVADGWHRLGLGDELMRRLVDHANGQGIERLYGDVLRENGAMLRLAARHGFQVTTGAGDPRLARVTRSPATSFGPAALGVPVLVQ